MKQILVVDDNLTNLKQINVQLAGEYKVALAKSGEQALQICTRERPDLVLLDIEMPDMDGFETILKFKGSMSLSQIPVIFLTANHDTETEIRALESGAVDFITKPVEKSILLHRIKLHLRFFEYQTHLENTVKALEDCIVTSFSDIIECRDENIEGHAARTSRYVGLLCCVLRERGLFSGELGEREVEMMVRATPLHDVGKIGVSDIILLKPSMLDDEEFGMMKKHTTIGADILRSMYKRTPTQHYLKYAIMIAECHHERFNGKGYPFGLRGTDIPLCARIMSVADVYDALVDTRVYKKSMSHGDACRVIYSGKGTQFDPDVVEAFRSVNCELEEASRAGKI
ncbi:MAG: response regulator [Synergistaceae bacterium]|jgi:putative two-component system response regulator|nr:response regulator [Synergistaceae bacterium]